MKVTQRGCHSKNVTFEYCCKMMKYGNEVGNIIYHSEWGGVYAHFQIMDLAITNCPWCGKKIEVIKKKGLEDYTVGDLINKRMKKEIKKMKKVK